MQSEELCSESDTEANIPTLHQISCPDVEKTPLQPNVVRGFSEQEVDVHIHSLISG